MINRQLYDFLIRHQLYVEGFKNYQAEKFRKELPKLVKSLREEFKKVPFVKLDDMTKKELLQFKRNIKKINNEFFDYWNKILIKDLEEFTKVDYILTKSILANYLEGSDKVIKDEREIDFVIKANSKKEDENKIFPFAWIFENDLDKINSYIDNNFIPASGMIPDDYLQTVSDYSLNKLERTVNIDFVNNEDTNTLLNNIIGTKDNNYKDGVLLAIERGQATVTNTMIQNITSILSTGIFATVFDKYIWISVIDSVTSDICRSRNLKVYTYSNGPRPPAHPRCRSKIVPFLGTLPPEENFTEWKNLQPAKIKKYAESNFTALNLFQFESKLEDILTV